MDQERTVHDIRCYVWKGHVSACSTLCYKLYPGITIKDHQSFIYSFIQILLNFLLKEVVSLLVLLHLLLPCRSLKVLAYLEHVFKIIKWENSKGFIDDKEWKKSQLHIDVCCQSYLAPVIRYGTILYNVKFVLKLHKVWISSNFDP